MVIMVNGIRCINGNNGKMVCVVLMVIMVKMVCVRINGIMVIMEIILIMEIIQNHW